MDNLTHSLVGALIGQAGLKKKTGLGMAALVIGANIPDVDAACFFWLDGVEHLAFRRGITHGPPALVLLPLFLAGLLYGYDRWQAGRGQKRFGRPEGRLPVRFGWLYALAFIGCLTHPALDWLNVYGIRLLEPFSSQWFYGDTLFIIDVWLWALMGFATWWSLRQEKRGGAWRRTGAIALAFVLSYIGANRVFSVAMEDRLRETGPIVECAEGFDSCDYTVIAAPVPFKPWQRELLANSTTSWSRIEAGGKPEWDRLVPLSDNACPDWSRRELASIDSQTNAFLFWSRAPFAERAPDGSVILRDARFYDPRARDRFSVALPDAACEPPAPEPAGPEGG